MQVWCEDKLIGEYGMSPYEADRYDVHIISTADFVDQSGWKDGDLSQAVMTSRKIRLEVKRRMVRLDSYHLEMTSDKSSFMAHFMKTNKIDQSTLSIYADFSRDANIYEWKVFVISAEDSEHLFDHPLYEPV